MDGILVFWKERGMTSHDCVIGAALVVHEKSGAYRHVRPWCCGGTAIMYWFSN